MVEGVAYLSRFMAYAISTNHIRTYKTPTQIFIFYIFSGELRYGIGCFIKQCKRKHSYLKLQLLK